VWLETVHRNAGPIARFAEHLRRGGAPGSAPALGEGPEVRVLHKGALTDAQLLEADQVLVAFNRTRVALNQRVRSLLGRKDPLERGDRIICLRNARPFGLFNGLQGVVSRVAPGNHLDFVGDDGREFRGVPFDPLQLGKPRYEYRAGGPHPFDYAYCVTGHKSQGSEWPQVLVQEQWCPYLDHRRWSYTVASRAQGRLTWVL
jgi:exodeoxyribonuclease-5